MAEGVLWPENGWDTDDDPDQRMRDEGQFRVARTLEEHGYGRGTPYIATQTCKRCGGTAAFLKKVNGQNTVRCANDNYLIYNASRSETGEQPRTAQTMRKDLRPGQQARILERDLGRCVMCGADDRPLTIGHFLSVDEGNRLGATREELSSDANLAVMCETCNGGLGARSVSPRFYAAIMVRLVQAEHRRGVGRITRRRSTSTPQAAGEERAVETSESADA